MSAQSKIVRNAVVLGLMGAAAGCTVVDYGTTVDFDRRGRGDAAYAAARGACRYDVARMEFRSRRRDSDHDLFITCMESKGFPYLGVSGYWIDRLCPVGTPGRKPDGTCRERRRLDGSLR